jgi:hypothetical protein
MQNKMALGILEPGLQASSLRNLVSSIGTSHSQPAEGACKENFSGIPQPWG